MAVASTIRRVARAVGTHRRIFFAVTIGVFILNLVLPPTVLSLARKPWDHFSFNPWLHNLPGWLVSEEATLGRKVEFVWNAALYWFIADSPYDAPEWGYSATVRDVARWLFIALLFGTYFALWAYRRTQVRACPPGRIEQGSGRAGALGTLLSTLGFSTMPCSVVGCGAPILPVLGLTLTGLSSVTLAYVYRISQAITALVFVGVLLGIIHLSRPIAADGTEGLATPAR